MKPMLFGEKLHQTLFLSSILLWNKFISNLSNSMDLTMKGPIKLSGVSVKKKVEPNFKTTQINLQAKSTKP